MMMKEQEEQEQEEEEQPLSPRQLFKIHLRDEFFEQIRRNDKEAVSILLEKGAQWEWSKNEKFTEDGFSKFPGKGTYFAVQCCVDNPNASLDFVKWVCDNCIDEITCEDDFQSLKFSFIKAYKIASDNYMNCTNCTNHTNHTNHTNDANHENHTTNHRDILDYIYDKICKYFEGLYDFADFYQNKPRFYGLFPQDYWN